MFDVISDLAFGEPLGMLERETDVLIGDSDHASKGVAAMIDYRGRTAAFLGLFSYLLPGSIWGPLTRWIPDGFVQRGLQETDTLSQIAQSCVRNLKYLNATIDEGLRMFATNAFGLPRVVPDGMDVSIDGKSFLPGTELSVPAYTMQRDPGILGSDAETFRPER
ncbi:hypothetical protein M422DRAFT_243495 [Sphaerobolus stellatus SS14]|nr:hypothetical protein M422DRAFT_243495 [Sphaerobolus stellatus SS14]